jgi:hypothetical protein
MHEYDKERCIYCGLSLYVELLNYHDYGYAFYKSDGVAFKDEFYNASDDDLKEWVKGFLMSMADYDEYLSFRGALCGLNVDVRRIPKLCAIAHDVIDNADEWLRFPSVPID